MAKLSPIALANSLAVAMAIIYLFLFILNIFSPSLFKLILNAQLLGGDAASLIPSNQSIESSLVALILVAITYWFIGFLIATIYNRFQQKSTS